MFKRKINNRPLQNRIKKELVDDSLIEKIYNKYKENKSPNDKLQFDVIEKFIKNSLLNECSRELYIIYKSDIRNRSVIRENIKAIQTKIVDKLLKLDDIKSIDNFESLKKITFVGGSAAAAANAKDKYNKIKDEYEEFKKFTDLFNEIFNPKFVYDDKTELSIHYLKLKKKEKVVNLYTLI